MTLSAATLRLEHRHTGEVLELRRYREHGVPLLEIRGHSSRAPYGPPTARPLSWRTRKDWWSPARCPRSSAADAWMRDPVQSVQLPRGIPHRWWNEGDAPLAFVGRARPVVDLDRYLQAVFEVMNASPPNRPSLFYLAHLSLRHRRTQAVLLMPRAVQAVLFPLVVALGTLLGRYRGTDWPGCPARCTGAPE